MASPPKETLEDLFERLGDAEHNRRVFKKQPALLITDYRDAVARNEILRLRKKIQKRIEEGERT